MPESDSNNLHRINKTSLFIVMVAVSFFVPVVFGHGVDSATEQFLTSNRGIAIGPFLYIGAKHMVTGYDHLLFLIGVIFFLFRARDIVVYVSLFTLGHSLTLCFGVLAGIAVNPFMIDAIIGLSVVYKGFDNLGGWRKIFGKQPDTKKAVLIFGLFHGLGLASKLLAFELPKQDLWKNLLAFNLGVEIGQCLALFYIFLLLTLWRRFHSYYHFAVLTNIALMTAGFILVGYQTAAYYLSL